MKSERQPNVLVIFVDGLGLGEPDAEINPVYRGYCPFLRSWLEKKAVPVDATLGVEGIPQSATGQATIYTGRNAAEFMGRHVEGHPGPTLKAFIREQNIFDLLKARGYTSTFANAYFIDDLAELRRRRRQSVTTVATLKAFGSVRNRRDMLANKAVHQDLTRASLRQRGYDGPLVTPEEAARHLSNIASTHHFTLFEYFVTDIVAHRGSEEQLAGVLSELDRFLSTVAKIRPADCLLVLISDHGNLEDARTKSHTMNPVPLVAVGPRAAVMKERVKSLVDFTPALLEIFAPK